MVVLKVLATVALYDDNMSAYLNYKFYSSTDTTISSSTNPYDNMSSTLSK